MLRVDIGLCDDDGTMCLGLSKHVLVSVTTRLVHILDSWAFVS